MKDPLSELNRYFGPRSTSGRVCIDEQPAPTDGVWVQIQTAWYYPAGSTAEHYAVVEALIRGLNVDGVLTGEIRVVRLERGIAVQYWEAK